MKKQETNKGSYKGVQERGRSASIPLSVRLQLYEFNSMLHQYSTLQSDLKEPLVSWANHYTLFSNYMPISSKIYPRQAGRYGNITELSKNKSPKGHHMH